MTATAVGTTDTGMKNTDSFPAYDDPLKECPLCGGKSLKPLYDIGRFERPFHVDRCASCGFIFMNPRFSDTVISSFYDEDYYSGSADYSYQGRAQDKKVRGPCMEEAYPHTPSLRTVRQLSRCGGILRRPHGGIRHLLQSLRHRTFSIRRQTCRIHPGMHCPYRNTAGPSPSNRTSSPPLP